MARRRRPTKLGSITCTQLSLSSCTSQPNYSSTRMQVVANQSRRIIKSLSEPKSSRCRRWTRQSKTEVPWPTGARPIATQLGRKITNWLARSALRVNGKSMPLCNRKLGQTGSRVSIRLQPRERLQWLVKRTSNSRQPVKVLCVILPRRFRSSIPSSAKLAKRVSCQTSAKSAKTSKYTKSARKKLSSEFSRTWWKEIKSNKELIRRSLLADNWPAR